MKEDKYKAYLIDEIRSILEGLGTDELIEAVSEWNTNWEADLFESIMEQVKSASEPEEVIGFYSFIKELRDGNH